MRTHSRLGFWFGIRLAAVALAVWTAAMLVLVDVDKLASHW
jgi:predicted hotdog family 3-hydroxylacyl-ACP dehydratase